MRKLGLSPGPVGANEPPNGGMRPRVIKYIMDNESLTLIACPRSHHIER